MPEQVTPRPELTPDPEMSLFGMLIAAPLAIIALPVLPFIAVSYAYGRMTQDAGRERQLE